MKTSVTMRKYTVNLGLLLIVMFVDLILMYGWSEGRVSHAKQKLYFPFCHNEVTLLYANKTHFGCLDTKIKTWSRYKTQFINEISLFIFLWNLLNVALNGHIIFMWLFKNSSMLDKSYSPDTCVCTCVNCENVNLQTWWFWHVR
jgi:hypothetical protein